MSHTRILLSLMIVQTIRLLCQFYWDRGRLRLFMLLALCAIFPDFFDLHLFGSDEPKGDIGFLIPSCHYCLKPVIERPVKSCLLIKCFRKYHHKWNQQLRHRPSQISGILTRLILVNSLSAILIFHQSPTSLKIYGSIGFFISCW